MSTPKSTLRGLPQITAAIDTRIRRVLTRGARRALSIMHEAGKAAEAPLTGNATGGASGGGGSSNDPPAYPETFTPVDASYLVLSASPALTHERILAAGSGIGLVDGGPGSSATVTVDSTVIRSSGDQEIDGTKTFIQAPVLEEPLRLLEQPGSNAVVEPGEVQIYARASPSSLIGGRIYGMDDSSSEHDLSVQQRSVFHVAQGDLNAGSDKPALAWAAAAFAPSGSTVSAAPIEVSTIGTSSGFDFATLGINTAASSGVLFGRWEWTSSFVGGPPAEWTNTQFAVGAALRRSGGSASVRARLRINNALRLSALYLSLNDAANANNMHILSLLESAGSANWYEALLPDVDISSWGTALRVLLTAQGTLSPANVGLTQVDLEWLMVEQWAR